MGGRWPLPEPSRPVLPDVEVPDDVAPAVYVPHLTIKAGEPIVGGEPDGAVWRDIEPRAIDAVCLGCRSGEVSRESYAPISSTSEPASTLADLADPRPDALG